MATFVNQKYLDKFVVEENPVSQNFIADEILTKVPVTLQAGTFATFDRHESKLVDDEQADTAPATEKRVRRPKDDETYSTTVHSLRDLVVDRQKRAYA
ncbi:MAG: hypothetical protein ACOC5T_06665, partial [Elusimicrobiota bacterium]